MSRVADAELVRACQAGDEVAFAELFGRYKARVMKSAFLIVGNVADSENVLQDTFVKVWQKLPALRDVSCFEPWLRRIMVRTAWDCCKKRSAEAPVAEVWQTADEAGVAGDSATPLDGLLAAESRDTVWAAVSRLDVKLRTVVVLYYYDELSVREIAEATGVLVGTVKSRLWAARRRLKQDLQDLQDVGGAAD